MTRLFPQNPDESRNFLKGRRFVFVVGDAKEKPEQAAVPEEEKYENRKQQARKEIDAIYESGKYDTYNFRNLPKEFKDHMRDNFGQWVDSNIAKYDKDKDSGINAAEYEEFKKMLNGKVSEILDRLIESKEKKKQQAIENKETAEQAKEAQERLEGVDTSKLNEASLENEDGCYTELLSYQKDFEKEASGFAALAGVFSGAKEKADHANKSHHKGTTAFGEMLYNWFEDIPEVKDAKAAKEIAIADFRAKLAEMKKRQKERRARGKTLNGAPEQIRGKVTAEYDEAKKRTREDLDLAKKAEEENRLGKELLQKEMEENEKRRKTAQREYEMLVSRLREAEQRKAEVEKRTGEMREAVTGFERTAEEARKRGGDEARRGGANEGAKTTAEHGKLTAADIERQAGDAAHKAREAAGELETGLGEADKVVGGMSGNAMRLQRQVADMLAARKLMSSDLDKRGKTEELLTDAVSGLTDNLEKLGTEQKQRLEQVDMLDSAIAETVIQVDTSNFELVKQGENYLKQLSAMDVSGPGFLDTAGAMVMGIPGAESAYNWSGDKLSAAWKWTKEVPVLGDGIEIVGYMGDGWVAAWDAIGDGLNWVGDKLHLGEAWDKMSNASKYLSIGNPTGNAGLDAFLDTFTGGGLGTVVEVFAGVTEGAKGLVQSVGMLLQHPFQTIRGLGGLLNHPAKIVDALIQKDKWSTESTSKIIGRALFEVIATVTGGGATVTSIKTAVSAMKLGGMSVSQAMLLAVKTFGIVFVKDMTKITVGTLRVLIKLPVTLTKGAADLLMWIARGGKRSPEALRVAAVNKTKFAAREAEALQALEAVRGNPGEFVKWLQKYPDQVDFAYRLVKKEKAAAKKAAQEARRTKEAVKRDEPGVEPSQRPGPDEITKPARRGAKEKGKVSPEDTAPTRGARISGYEDTLPDRPRGVRAADDLPSSKKVERETRGILEHLDRTAELTPAETRLLQRKPDYRPKPLSPERMKLVMEAQEALHKNKTFSSIDRKFSEALKDVHKKHAEELKGVAPDSAEYRALRNRHRRDEAMLDTRRLLDALPEDELEMLTRSIDRLDETLAERVLRQEYTMILDSERRPVRVYFGNSMGEGAFGMVQDVAYAVGTEGKIRTGAVKMPRDMKSLKADPDFKDMTVSQINDLLNSIDINFYNEGRTFAAVRAFPHREGLLRPRVISNDPASRFIIYDKIDAGSGQPVRLSDRAGRGDRVEEVLGFAADAMDGERNLARNGWFHLDIKPQNIFVGYDENGALRGYLGDLSLNNLDDVPDIRLIEVPTAKSTGSKNFGVLKVNRSDFSRSLQLGTTPGYFSFEHVNKSFAWVKENVAAGKAVPESVMALPGNNAFAVTLDRIFKIQEKIDIDGVPVTVYRRFNSNVLPSSNRPAILSELDGLINRLKNENSGIDITTRQAEFRRIQKMIAEARKQDEALKAFKAAG